MLNNFSSLPLWGSPIPQVFVGCSIPQATFSHHLAKLHIFSPFYYNSLIILNPLLWTPQDFSLSQSNAASIPHVPASLDWREEPPFLQPSVLGSIEYSLAVAYCISLRLCLPQHYCFPVPNPASFTHMASLTGAKPTKRIKSWLSPPSETVLTSLFFCFVLFCLIHCSLFQGLVQCSFLQ